MDFIRKSVFLSKLCFISVSLGVLAYFQPVSAGDSVDSIEVPIELPDGAQGMSHTILLPPEAIAERNRQEKNYKQKGYIEKMDEAPRAEYVMARMKDREKMVKLGRLKKDNDFLGFRDISNEAQTDLMKLPSQPTLMPNRYKSAKSKSYLMRGGHKLKQLHTDTRFGTLLIDEMRNVTSANVDTPNITIAGEPAKIVHIRHQDNKWATVVFAPHKDQVFIVEANKRLRGNKKKLFVQMVEELIEDRAQQQTDSPS